MIPSELLHYRVIQPLGSGGMGDVYLAEDTKLGRRVALKVLPPGHVADPERRRRFEREARAVAALNHPNIVTIHAVEDAGDTTFLAMEHVEGQTLAALLQKGRLPVAQVLRLAIPLADALSAAHERGVTHRDLKPANVMVTTDGRVKVLDFGLARLSEASAPEDAAATALKPDPLTGEGHIVGTVTYMSPEQAEGRPVDHRTDLFSFGVLLYEMATGERPFKGDTNMSVLSAILRDTPRSVSEINPSVPRDLARIVKRALVKDPEHRYQTAKDLRNDLETLKEELDSGSLDLSASASAAAAPRPTVAQAPSRRPVLIVGLAALAVLGIVGWIVWSQLGSRNQAPGSTERAFEQMRLTRLTSSGKAQWAAVSADGRYVVHVVVDGAKQSLWLRQTATPSNVPIVPPSDVRFDGVSFSPDGNFVYYTVYPLTQSFSTVYQVAVLGGQSRKVIDDVDSPLAFSPDGKQIGFVRGYQRLGESAIVVASVDGTNERKLAVKKHPLSFMLNNLTWSPDGSTIVAIQRVDEQGRMKLVAAAAATGQETPFGGRLWTSIESVAWMPDGRGLVTAAIEDSPGASPQLWYVSYPGGEARRLTNDLNMYGQVSVSADGRTLVAVQREVLSHLWVGPSENVAAARQITTGTGRVDNSPSWTPDGRIVYMSNASGNYDIWIADASGENARQLTVDPGHDSNPEVTPNGRGIVFYSSRANGIWHMDIDGGNQRVLVPGQVSVGAVTSDSKWLYYTSFAEPQRRVFRIALAGGTAERLTAHWPEKGIAEDGIFYSPTVSFVGLSPDGRTGLVTYLSAEERGWRTALVSMESGKPTPLTGTSTFRTLDGSLVGGARFSADGRSIIGFAIPGGVLTLSRWPLAGGPPVALATAAAGAFLSFSFSADGKQVAMGRGTVTSDVVLMTQEK